MKRLGAVLDILFMLMGTRIPISVWQVITARNGKPYLSVEVDKPDIAPAFIQRNREWLDAYVVNVWIRDGIVMIEIV